MPDDCEYAGMTIILSHRGPRLELIRTLPSVKKEMVANRDVYFAQRWSTTGAGVESDPEFSIFFLERSGIEVEVLPIIRSRIRSRSLIY